MDGELRRACGEAVLLWLQWSCGPMGLPTGRRLALLSVLWVVRRCCAVTRASLTTPPTHPCSKAWVSAAETIGQIKAGNQSATTFSSDQGSRSLLCCFSVTVLSFLYDLISVNINTKTLSVFQKVAELVSFSSLLPTNNKRATMTAVHQVAT